MSYDWLTICFVDFKGVNIMLKPYFLFIFLFSFSNFSFANDQAVSVGYLVSDQFRPSFPGGATP
jgi:hypothetical protein|tara:strand:- start:1 stop:192 length:192 start_codon:yes stop_codon:yes gene_type:complete